MHWCPDATQNELWGLSQGVGKVVYGEKEPSKHKCGSAPASEVLKGHCWRERVESNISFRSPSAIFPATEAGENWTSRTVWIDMIVSERFFSQPGTTGRRIAAAQIE